MSFGPIMPPELHFPLEPNFWKIARNALSRERHSRQALHSSRWQAMNFRVAPKGPRALAQGQGILRQEEKFCKQLRGVPAPARGKGSLRNHLRRREKQKKDVFLFWELGRSIKTASIFQVHLPEAASIHSPPYLKHGRGRRSLPTSQQCGTAAAHFSRTWCLTHGPPRPRRVAVTKSTDQRIWDRSL